MLGALATYSDAFSFLLVTFATLGYGDIVLAPGSLRAKRRDTDDVGLAGSENATRLFRLIFCVAN